MASIEQSIIHPEFWFVKIGNSTIKTNKDEVVELVRSFMSTSIGKTMLENYIKRITKK